MKVIQLSDCHLMADPAAELKGIKTRSCFEAVLHVVQSRHADAERIIVTGDIAHDEQLATYLAFAELVAPLRNRLRLVPGNHDDRGHLRTLFTDRMTIAGDRIVFSEKLGPWQLIGLDSHVPGQLHGELGRDQRAWLEQEIRGAETRSICLFLHHPPRSVGSPWLDSIQLVDGPELLEVARCHEAVRMIVCGHVHQERAIFGDSFPILTTPSASVQFRPETERLEVDPLPPGYRVFRLGEDGGFTSWTERVEMAK